MNYEAVMKEATTLPPVALKPPRGSNVVGVFRTDAPAHKVHDERIIYEERMLDVEATKATKRIRLDGEGKEIWKKGPNGEALYPFFELDLQYKVRRYVLLGLDSSRHVKRVYNFEPTAEELADIAAREAEKTFLRDFVKEAAAAGLTAGQLVARLKADIMGTDADPSAVSLGVTEEIVEREMALLEEEADAIERPADEVEHEGVDPAEIDSAVQQTLAMPRAPKGKAGRSKP